MKRLVALDFETHLISPERISPKPVCLAYYDGVESKIVVGEDMKALLVELFSQGDSIVFHNAEFDLAVMATEWPELMPHIFESLDNCRVHDTIIRHKLYDLSTIGYIRRKGYSLSYLAKKYLKFDYGSLKSEDSWRMRYSELDGVPLEEWPQEAIDYPKLDVELTHKLFYEQEEIKNDLGYGSINTEALQIASGFVLKMSTLGGIKVDQEHVQNLAGPEEDKYIESLNFLVDEGFAEVTKNGTIKKSMIKIQEYLEEKYSDIMERTETGKLKVGLADLECLGVQDELVDNLIQLAIYHKNCTTYWPQLKHERVHPVYDILKETGRTSSRVDKLFPSLNIQNQPRKEGVRECFIPQENNLFITCDYSNLELCSTAQACKNLFGESKLLDDINAGYDIHSLTGSKIMGIQYDQFKILLQQGNKEVKHYRTLAKPINLGIPGGMGINRIVFTAKDLYQVEMTYDEAKKYRRLFLNSYPEIRKYFKHIRNKFGDRGPYSYSINGRFRNNCTYTSCSNGELLQSLSADGAKNAVFKVGEACYNNKLNNSLYGSKFSWFIHDEIGIEIPKEGSAEKMKELSNLMILSMKEVMPDVKITCESMLMERWSKDVFIDKVVYDSNYFKGVIV
jgi:DNA polymerase I-like protein with 3'-5' exonuclease and polymerase domains